MTTAYVTTFEGIPAEAKMNAEYVDMTKDVFVDGQWPAINKQDTIDEYQEEYFNEFHDELTKINRIIFLNDENYEEFTHSFLTNRDFLGENRGGSNSFFETEKEHFWELTDEERTEYRANAYVLADLVVNADNTGEYVLVNQEGYGYARYVGFVRIDNFSELLPC
jgi:hypothetical protein